LWEPVFSAGIPLMDWKLYIKTYLPLIFKMANFNHTATSRLAAANMLAATINEAAGNRYANDSMLNAFFTLGQDTDLVIRKAMLKNYHTLIPITKDKYLEEKLFSEVTLTLYTISSWECSKKVIVHLR